MKNQEFGTLINWVIKSFSKIEIDGPYNCKTYSICPCAYENKIKIDISSKIYIEILLEGSYITDAYIIHNKFFKKKISLKWFFLEKDSKTFNIDNLETKIEKIARESEYLIKNKSI
ncbi:MAG: hypothetical protein WAV86_08655 [Lutibacter sp.]